MSFESNNVSLLLDLFHGETWNDVSITRHPLGVSTADPEADKMVKGLRSLIEKSDKRSRCD